MQPGTKPGPGETTARPLAELLACPPETGRLLDSSAQYIEFHEGDTIFHQGDVCRGLYLVMAGELLRRTERLETRLVLGAVHPGDLVELAAVLGELRHTYTLIAQSPGSLMMLAFESLKRAFQTHPPLRMQLLTELAREVSRGYKACCATRLAGIRRRGGIQPATEQ